MDISSNTTPKTPQRRSLGLSRRIVANNSKTIALTPVIGTTPDSPVNSFQCQNEIATTEPNKPIGRVSDSVNSRIAGNTSTNKPNIARHKLSLCKDTNENMTRKRLLSQKAKSSKDPKRLKLESDSELLNERDDQPESSTKIENCDTGSPSNEAMSQNSESSSETSLQIEIDRITKQIATTEKYQQQIYELQDLIPKWRAAGLKTIEDIQDKIQPTQDVTDILAHFNIDPGLFNLSPTE